MIVTPPSPDDAGAADWKAGSTAAIDVARMSSDYPCTFASRARLIVGHVDASPSSGDFAAVPAMVLRYLALLNTLEDERSRAHLLLAVAFRPETGTRTVEEYRRAFWSLLRFLRANDPEPWPADMPDDPDDPRWSFCFGGVPIFVNANTPAHVQRRSRNLGASFVVLFQPRAGIDFVAPPDATGDRTRATIRKRIGHYDALPPYAGFATYGTPDNRDWTLYFLPDAASLNVGRCPLVMAAEC